MTNGGDWTTIAAMDTETQPPAAPAGKTTRQRLLTLLKLGVTALGLFLVLRGLDFGALLGALRTVRLGWMAVGAAGIALSLVVRAYRWHIVLHGVGSSIRFGRLVELYLVGSFFNAFLPSGLGGDVVRAAEAAQDVTPDVAAGTVLVDRLTGLLALFAMALAVLPFRPAGFPPRLAWTIGAIGGVGLLGGLALIEGRLLRAVVGRLPGALRAAGNGFLDRLAATIQRCHWRSVAAALLVSLIFNLMQIGWWVTTGRALGLRVPFGYFVLVVPIMSLAVLVPSIGGLGVRETVAPALFAGAGLAPEQAVALTLLVFALERVASLLGAPVYLWTTVRASRRHAGQPARPR